MVFPFKRRVSSIPTPPLSPTSSKEPTWLSPLGTRPMSPHPSSCLVSRLPLEPNTRFIRNPLASLNRLGRWEQVILQSAKSTYTLSGTKLRSNPRNPRGRLLLGLQGSVSSGLSRQLADSNPSIPRHLLLSPPLLQMMIGSQRQRQLN